MKARLLVLAVVAVAVIACLLLAVAEPTTAPPVRHGDVSTRFQPNTPEHPTGRERLAGMGSIKDLRPVETKSR